MLPSAASEEAASDWYSATAVPMYRLPPTEDYSLGEQSLPSDQSTRASWDVERESVEPPIPAATPPELPVPPQETIDELETAWSADVSSITPPASQPDAQAMQPPAAVPYTPATAELSQQLLPAVQKAYSLAKHGAVYAAQTDFIRVLRRVAQAKDATAGVETHSRALAAGLRALDEADDFVPQGVQLEAEMNVAVVMSAHRTPELLPSVAITRPDEAIALYHQFAREQLALAVDREQAGSMSLYGLGKLENRLALQTNGELRHERKALTMFLAALDAGPSNQLAANEIGVLLARGGQPAAASELFRRAIDIAPSSITYHNLAIVDRQMGFHAQAEANENYSQHLAALDRQARIVSRNNGVEWVAPQDLSPVAQQSPLPVSGSRFTKAQPRQAAPAAQQPTAVGQAETAAKWPQKLVPGVFRR